MKREAVNPCFHVTRIGEAAMSCSSNALWVGVGGFLGCTLRYGLSGLVHALMRSPTFPYGTLVVNVSGCFVMGVLGGLAIARGW